MASLEVVEVAPELLGGAEALAQSAARLQGGEDAFEIDAGNLMIVDPSPLDKEGMKGDVNTACVAMATSMTQALVAHLFSLPSKPAAVGRFVDLPTPTMRTPRHKPLPKPKVPTRWEKFAQEKGIVKRKKEKYVFDENTSEWRRRHGYQRVNDMRDVAIVEAKASDKVGEDPFALQTKKKKDRVRNQEERRLANLKAAAKQGGKGALPATISLSRPLGEAGAGSARAPRADLLAGASSAAASTASMGRFDPRAKHDTKGKVQGIGKRKQRAPVVGGGKGRAVSKQESDVLEDAMARVVRAGEAAASKDVVNIERAARQVDRRPTNKKTPKKAKGFKARAA